MGWLSDTWSSVKDTASSAWGSIKEETMELTGDDSFTDSLLNIGTLGGYGRGMDIIDSVGGMLEGPPPPSWATGQGVTGPLMGNAPSSLTMGTGGQPAPQTVQPSAQDLAGLFGDSGYQYGGPSQTSTALLQSNPEAYQYSPLMNGMS